MTGGTNLTTSAMPSSAASEVSEVGRSRPLPEGPPTIGTTSRERSSGLRSSSTRHRAQQHVGRLQRLDPPGEEQHVGVGRQPQLAAHAGSRSRGRKTDRSTPGLTTSTRPGSAS